MSKWTGIFADMYDKMEVTNPSGVGSPVGIILPNIARYQNAAAEFKMPWQIVGCLHYRESNCDFTSHLANGDPLSADTIHVPKGIMAPLEPPYVWEEAAIAALTNQFKGWNIDANTFTWDIGGALYFCQCWHGFGMPMNNHNDPYLWNYTNYYTSGGYIADGDFNPWIADENAGCAPLLKALGFQC